MEDLLKEQTICQYEIESFVRNFKKTPKDRRTEGYLKRKLEVLDDLWKTFKSTNHELLLLFTDSDKTRSYFANDVFAEIEETYCTTCGLIEEQLKPFKTDKNKPSVAPLPNTDKIQGNGAESNDLRLPRIQIPRFDGNYQTWASFHDLFLAIVHNNSTISNVQKLHYLKTSLSGEAEQLIRHLQVTDTNYVSAWEILVKRYQNNRVLVNAQLSLFSSMPYLTVDSASGIKSMLDTSNEILEALKGLKINIQNWDPLIIHLLTQKLTKETISQWEYALSSRDDPTSVPKFDEFTAFLESRFRTLEAISSAQDGHQEKKTTSNKQVVTRSHVVDFSKCPVCSKNHRIKYCKKFKGMKVTDRFNLIKKQSRCFNCFSSAHLSKDCTLTMNCQRCGKRHNTMLHFDQPVAGDPGIQNQQHFNNNVRNHCAVDNQNTQLMYSTIQTSSPVTNTYRDNPLNNQQQPSSTTQSYSSFEVQTKQCLLATALIKVHCSRGGKQVLRALLDQGSQASFITEDAVQRLGLKKKTTHAVVTGLGQQEAGKILSLTSCVIEPHFESRHKFETDAFVLKNITSLLPSSLIDVDNWNHIQGIQLADPIYFKPGKIDMLLGVNIYTEILETGLIKGHRELPTAQQTLLGWILSGPIKSSLASKNHSISLHCEINLDAILRQFWEIENIPITKRFNVDEEKCEEIYNTTHQRTPEGRYIVKLPFKNQINKPNLGDSRVSALSRFFQVERKLDKKVDLKTEYKMFLDEYLQLGHMEKVPPLNERHSTMPQDCYYLPHHAVLKENSSTTKLRVVFDASAKTTNKLSLNDNLFTGPTIQQDLCFILLRWRKYLIAFTADIEKMYRQILVSPDQTNYQRILWRGNLNEPIEEYRLKTVTYGTSCAPYLAIKTLRQLALDESRIFPNASKVTLNDFYVDDLMSGTQSIEEAIHLQNDIRKLLQCGGFKLRKWTCNNEKVLKNIPKEDREFQHPFNIELNETIKALGIHWNPITDKFGFKVRLNSDKVPCTKRTFLSEIARLFDPLGWLAPTVIIIKTMFQQLWLTGISWDDNLPENLLSHWKNFRDKLHELEEIQIPRWISFNNHCSSVELHGFCDASTQAYAAVIYTRCVDINGIVHISLLTAKTKVAPIKQISLPRLELCGAGLVTKLIQQAKEALQIQPISIYAWTDSTIVLSWLRSHPSRWKTFVANRVSEIQEFLDCRQWRHVSSSDNPADCATRGLNPNELKEHSLWWFGPHWLKESQSNWPKPLLTLAETNTEIRKVTLTVPEVKRCDFDLLNKFSNYDTLVRVTAYCKRFIENMRLPKETRKVGYLTINEINTATNSLIKIVQNIEFNKEMAQMKEEKHITKDSRILNLNPFIDADGLLRVRGRLRNSDMSYSQKFPIILPDKNMFTKLLIDNMHKTTLHGGCQLILNLTRKRFWILNARNEIRHQIHKCIKCFRQKANSRQQLMGDLPQNRVRASRPFSHTGVDFTGAITIRESKCRGRVKTSKGYIAVFICMSTKAIHLEVVSELSTDAFLAAFRRFVSRRGLCSHMYSDCGTNFVGANTKLLKAQKDLGLPDDLDNVLSRRGVSWHFIPPASPHVGGLWEAGVKSTKHHLKRVIGNSLLTFEELTTLTTQIEACLNSRPLCPITNDPDDFTPLTPGHFLTGDAILAIPEPSLLDTTHVLRRWQLIQRMYQDFWKRWVSEYLVRLQQRPKWLQRQPNLKVGNLVIIKDERLPPTCWLLGRIIEVHPGADGLVRVVTIKCQGKSFKRPVSKICLLPIIDNEIESNN